MDQYSTTYFTGLARLGYMNYGNDRVAMVLIDEEGERVMTVSVNMVDEKCPLNCTFIKDYSENEGILEELIRLRKVRKLKEVPAGHTSVWLCQIIDKDYERKALRHCRVGDCLPVGTPVNVLGKLGTVVKSEMVRASNNGGGMVALNTIEFEWEREGRNIIPLDSIQVQGVNYAFIQY